MEGMNPVLAGIYGTAGHEKVASSGGRPIRSLADLASAMSASEEGLEKKASASQRYLDDFVNSDVMGRAAAQREITALEQAAVAGEFQPLMDFLQP